MRRRRTEDEKLPNSRPEPCVAVEIAPGDLLRDDVALVREPEALRPERLAELADRRRRADDDAPGSCVERVDPRQAREVEQQAVGTYDRRERMAGSGDADVEPVARRCGNQLADLVFALRARCARRLAALVPDPVSPHGENISRCLDAV